MGGASILWSRWKVLAQKIGTFQSKILFSLFYFLVMPPFAVIVKLFSDPLGLKKSSSAKWHPKEARQNDFLKESRRQF